MLKIFKNIIGLVQMPLKKYIFKQTKCLLFMLLYTIFSLAFPGFISIIVDKGVKENDVPVILVQCALMFLCGALMIIFQYLQQISFYKLAQDIIYGIKQNVFEKLLTRNLMFWSNYKVGDIITILENDINKIETLLTSTISSLAINLLVAIGIGVLLTAINPIIGVTILIMSLIFAYLQRNSGQKVQDGMTGLREEMGGLSGVINEVLNNLPAIQMTGLSDFEKERFTKRNQSVVSSFILQMKKMTKAQLIGVSFNVFGIFWVLVVGAFEVARGTLSVGVLFSMTIYVQRLYGPIVALGNAYITIKNTKPMIDKVQGLIENEDEILGGDGFQKISGRIVFDNVSFKYHDKWVFKDFSLDIKEKDKVGIVGENGSGKTTLIRLFAKLCIPQKGCIFLDDTKIDDIGYAAFQNYVGIVPQKCFLPNGRMREIMDIHNDKEEKRLYELMQSLGLPVTKFKDGLNSEISENMQNLSGGEIQKLCIIRSILQNKQIYIFDEPTAAMDLQSEKEFCRIIRQYLIDKTVLIVTHRQEVLEVCDKVITLTYISNT